jgi:cell division protein ZipA
MSMKPYAWRRCKAFTLPEFRWILLGLGLVLIGGIWWWGARRSAQAFGDSQLRETQAKPEISATAFDNEPAVEEAQSEPEAREAREWGVPPFEPLSIRTADFDNVPVLDGPMLIDANPLHVGSLETLSHEPAPPQSLVAEIQSPTPPAPTPPPVQHIEVPQTSVESTDEPPAAPNVSELQRIVTIRVAMLGEARCTGVELAQALQDEGLEFGRYQVFHRTQKDGRSLFCAASLVEPGTFDVANMAAQEFRGVTLFAVLPGPIDALLIMDELLTAARGLAERLPGMVQDSKGVPLSPQRAAALRDDVARFQALLP